MGFTDYKNEDAIDMLADILEPASVIFADKELAFLAKQGNQFKVAKVIMKKYSKELIQVLARIDDVPVEEYTITAPQILIKLMKLMNDRDMMYFFGFAPRNGQSASSGSATGNTEEAVE